MRGIWSECLALLVGGWFLGCLGANVFVPSTSPCLQTKLCPTFAFLSGNWLRGQDCCLDGGGLPPSSVFVLISVLDDPGEHLSVLFSGGLMGVGFIPCLLLSLYLVSEDLLLQSPAVGSPLRSCGGHHVHVWELPHRPRPGRWGGGRKAILGSFL